MTFICEQLGVLVSSSGLMLDIVGVILIFLYGLPEALSREGHQYIITKQKDEKEALKAKKYDFRARIGLTLLILGFALQLVGHWI